MNAPIPDRLSSIEGSAWLLRARLLKQAFDERGNGQFSRRCNEVEDAYADLSAKHFVEGFGI